MYIPLMTVAAILTLAVVFVLLPVIAHTFQRYRHKRVVKCPETAGLAEVDINSRRAAFSSAFGSPLLKVKNCTLWPKRKDCAQGCLKE